MFRRRWLVVPLAVALFVTLSSVASAAEKAIWGPVDFQDGRSAFPTYRSLGVDTWQETLNWPRIAPTRPANPTDPNDPAYKWPEDIEKGAARAKSSGINVALLVFNSPGWANGGQSEIHAPKASDFADFLTAASRRYPSVRRWMIWGEPNRADRFLPNREKSPVGPRAYAPILDAAYGALKRQSRRNIVIGGQSWTGGTVKPALFMRFLRLPNGKPPRLDWYGHNPFPFRFPNLREVSVAEGFRDISDLDDFSRQLRRTYGRGTPFWLSEFTVLSDRGSDTFALSITKAQQARWLRAAYGIADRLNSVQGLGWLSLVDQAEAPGSSNWGLLSASGARKPAFAAYAAAPSERLRPLVRLSRRGRVLRVAIRARTTGKGTVDLVTRGGRVLIRRGLRLRRGRTRVLRLALPRRAGGSRIRVLARRGARVERRTPR